MIIRVGFVIFLITIYNGSSYALEANEILIIANSEIEESQRIARYYCEKRAVPVENIIALPLGTQPATRVSREDYNEKLAEPLRVSLTSEKFTGKIKCLLTTYGVPIVVTGRGQLQGRESELKRLKELIEQGTKLLEDFQEKDPEGNSAEKKTVEQNLSVLQSLVDIILGKETSASVDSELSMILFGNYELYRWQANMLQANQDISQVQDKLLSVGFKTLMVSRLDGPGEQIAIGLVDKAISAERTGLKGIAYFDSRGRYDKSQYGLYDQSLRDLAVLTKLHTSLPVLEERTSNLFAVGRCPQTAVYCGWYSLSKYVDAFDFVDGAVGFHIASFEAVGLRDPNASQWCPAMLADGITATLGSVEEPYLHSFPQPKSFFTELYNGFSLVEAYYRTNPFNSWRLILIGDPLYRPFKKPQSSQPLSNIRFDSDL